MAGAGGRVDMAERGGPCARQEAFGALSGNDLDWDICVERVIRGSVWKRLGWVESYKVLGRSPVLWLGCGSPRTRTGRRIQGGVQAEGSPNPERVRFG